MTIKGVVKVGVVGIPDEEDGYHPMALVIKENGSKLTEEFIINYVKGEGHRACDSVTQSLVHV